MKAPSNCVALQGFRWPSGTASDLVRPLVLLSSAAVCAAGPRVFRTVFSADDRSDAGFSERGTVAVTAARAASTAKSESARGDAAPS